MFSEGIVKTIIARVQADGAQEEEFLCIRYSDYSADSMLGYCRWASCLYLVLYCHSSLSFRRDKAIFSYSSWTINMYQPDKGKILTDVVEAVSAYGQSSLLISVSSCHRFMFVNKEATLGTPLKGALISWLRTKLRINRSLWRRRCFKSVQKRRSATLFACLFKMTKITRLVYYHSLSSCRWKVRCHALITSNEMGSGWPPSAVGAELTQALTSLVSSVIFIFTIRTLCAFFFYSGLLSL